MIEQDGTTYKSAKYGKALVAAEAKVGKTNFLVGSALGLMPWQRAGGLVSKPQDLHVLSFDSGALSGVSRFLLETCGAPKDALKYNVYNFQDDVARATASRNDYDFSLYSTLVSTVGKIRERVAASKGVPVVIVSSLTGLAYGVERGIIGPPESGGSGGKGYSDRNKWTKLGQLLNEIRSLLQVDDWHCFWEAHIDHAPDFGGDDKQGGGTKEVIRVRGEAGRNWAYNVEQVFRVRRQFGQPHPGTKCDQVYLDTRPTLDFIASGRNFTEALAPKEYDLTVAFQKLGLAVGGWNAKPQNVVQKAAPNRAVTVSR